MLCKVFKILLVNFIKQWKLSVLVSHAINVHLLYTKNTTVVAVMGIYKNLAYWKKNCMNSITGFVY